MSPALPGSTVSRTVTPREIMLSREGMIQVPVIVDGTLSMDGSHGAMVREIRAGWPLGRVTSTGRFVPCKRTKTNGAGGTGTDVTVVNAAAFRAGDAIDVGGDANKTIASVNYSTNTITLSSSITWAASEDVVSRDGSQNARGILLDTVSLLGDDGVTLAHRGAGMLIQGAVKSGTLLGDLAAVRADAGARLAGIRFSDEHGQ